MTKLEFDFFFNEHYGAFCIDPKEDDDKQRTIINQEWMQKKLQDVCSAVDTLKSRV